MDKKIILLIIFIISVLWAVYERRNGQPIFDQVLLSLLSLLSIILGGR